MPIVRAGSAFRTNTVYVRTPAIPLRRVYSRGMGAVVQDPCACFFPLAGVPTSMTNPNNLPQCDPNTGLATSCQGVDRPPCAGIAFGQPGYTACVQNATSPSNPQAAQEISNAATMGITYNPAAEAAPLIAAAAAAEAPAPTPAPAPSAPAQSNAPNAAVVSQGVAQSNAPNAGLMTPQAVTAALPSTGTLFGIPTTWLLIGGAVVVGGLLLFGGKR